jgi:hypothetical protein
MNAATLRGMTHLLFESPLQLLVAELGVALVLVWWLRRSAGSARRPLIGYLVLAVALLVIQKLVVTDPEKIRTVAEELARAVDFGQMEIIRGHLAEDFAAWGLDRSEFVDFVHDRLEVYRVDEVWIGGTELAIDRDVGRIEFAARARVSTDQMGPQPYLGRWRLTLSRVGRGWRVNRVEYLAGPGAANAIGPIY